MLLECPHQWTDEGETESTTNCIGGIDMSFLYAARIELADGRAAGTGWLPPIPDLRDFTDTHDEVAPMVKKLGFADPKSPPKMPSSVDLRS
jgi:hypothetical protein